MPHAVPAAHGARGRPPPPRRARPAGLGVHRLSSTRPLCVRTFRFGTRVVLLVWPLNLLRWFAALPGGGIAPTSGAARRRDLSLSAGNRSHLRIGPFVPRGVGG